MTSSRFRAPHPCRCFWAFWFWTQIGCLYIIIRILQYLSRQRWLIRKSRSFVRLNLIQLKWSVFSRCEVYLYMYVCPKKLSFRRAKEMCTVKWERIRYMSQRRLWLIQCNVYLMSRNLHVSFRFFENSSMFPFASAKILRYFTRSKLCFIEVSLAFPNFWWTTQHFFKSS